jgi:hypothetical protein
VDANEVGTYHYKVKGCITNENGEICAGDGASDDTYTTTIVNRCGPAFEAGSPEIVPEGAFTPGDPIITVAQLSSVEE